MPRIFTNLAASCSKAVFWNRPFRERDLRLHTAINNISHGLCFFDGEQRLILCNDRYIEMYRLSPDRVKPGVSLREIVDLRFEAGTVPAMSKGEYLEWRNSIAVSDKPSDTIVELKNGLIFCIRHRPMPDGGWVATHEDITAQRTAERVLAQAQAETETAKELAQAAHARLAEALAVVPEGFALLDKDDRFVLWNSRYLDMYGMSRDAISVGARFEDVLRAGIKRGQYLDAVQREEAWLSERLARHAQESNTHEQRITGDRWIRVQERRTADGGSVGVRIDITDLKKREQSFRLLFDSNPMPMWVMDIATLKLLAVNEAAKAHYGYTHEQLLQMDVLDLRVPEDRVAFDEYIRTGQNSGGRRVWHHQKADGTVVQTAVYSGDLQYNGRSARLCAAVDLTELKRAEEKLLDQKQQTETAINNMAQGLLMFDAEGKMILCNRRYIEMYGLSSDVVKPGCSLRELIVHRQENGLFPGDVDQYCQQLIQGIAEGKTLTRIFELRDGRTVHGENRPMRGGGWVATHEDVTERRQAQARIEHLARHDGLTDLNNRSAFNDFISESLAGAEKNAEKLAVVCMDIDRFKEVNDVFGHATGDALLREVAKRLRDAAGTAFVARLGGDEFSLVVTDTAQPAGAEELIARIYAAFTEAIEIGGHPLRVGLSIGVAIYPTDAADAAGLLANADAALYRAKHEERGSVRFFAADMDKRLRERRALQHDLKSAIERHELRLHYQPQARIGGEIVGFEALARWLHPTRGYIPPGVFIPLAENSGLILQIGEWILREACREAASWAKPLQIAINLSPIQFQHGDLPSLVHAVLLETGLSPRLLELEITEGVLVGDFNRAVSILRRLKALGVRIAMDDFGTGYSSLSYLQAFPFDRMKIDQAFISKLSNNPQSAEIIRAIIGLGRSLSLPVTAEGVETEEQLAFLTAEGCDEIQGYLIGRPLPIDDYANFIGKPVLDIPNPIRAV